MEPNMGSMYFNWNYYTTIIPDNENDNNELLQILETFPNMDDFLRREYSGF